MKCNAVTFDMDCDTCRSSVHRAIWKGTWVAGSWLKTAGSYFKTQCAATWHGPFGMENKDVLHICQLPEGHEQDHKCNCNLTTRKVHVKA
jgi:hypothetical protein